MTLAVVYTRALSGIDAPAVEVEAHLANGLPAFNIVGLPDTEVKESRDRVRAAIIQSGFEFPAKKITVNLAPADLPKESGHFDLPIAIAILAASGQVKLDKLPEYELAGELALSGKLRPIRGAIAMVWRNTQTGRSFILPKENAEHVAHIKQVCSYPATTLAEVAAHFNQIQALVPQQPNNDAVYHDHASTLDLADIKGQHTARLALEIAAAGGHSLLMMGPPGTGKSMLAQRLPSILPALTDDEFFSVWALHSLLPENQPALSRQRPFRAPHHSASAAAIAGGGSQPKPGEISLAHHGVLFLDEFPEFDRKVLEILREPLENGEIHLSRAARQTTYPAKFQLVAAMNPCPCGYLGHPTKPCRCTPDAISRYRNKISGPLLDRIDLIIEVPAISGKELHQAPAGESSEIVQARVLAARKQQIERQGKVNAELSGHELDQSTSISDDAKTTLAQTIDKLSLSARSYHRILRVSQTLADLNHDALVTRSHILRAIGLRRTF